MAEEWNTKQFIELVVLEQVVASLLPGTAEWVQCYRPAHLDEAMQLVEDYILAVPDLGVLRLSHSVSLLCSYPLKPAARTISHLPFLPLPL